MAITYPLDFPTTFGVSQFTIDLVKAVSVTESPFSFAQQVQEHPGEAWEISFVMNLLNREQAETYNSFLLRLAGRVGTFTMTIPGSEEPRGVATGTPLVNGASQTGRDLNIDGVTASTTGIYKAGDFIQLGTGSSTKLHKILKDVDSNGSGEATLELAPKIITAPADNASIVTSNPKGLFRLKNNKNPINITPPNQFTLSIQAREVI
jgi:hypothetical protein